MGGGREEEGLGVARPALRTRGHTRRWGRAAGARPGLHGLPREARRTVGRALETRGRKPVSLWAWRPVRTRLAASVSVAAEATPSPARTILTAAPPPARVPETRLGAAGARGRSRRGRSRPRRRARGVDAGRGGSRGRTPASAVGWAVTREGAALGGATRAPPSRRPRVLRPLRAPSFCSGRRPFPASCVTSLSTAALTS